MGSGHRGYLYAFAAYALWGFVPLYFKLIREAGALEILAHRVGWSVVLVGLIVLVTGRLKFLRGWSRRVLLGIALASVLVGANWGIFIYGVNTDRVVEASLGYFINPLVTVLLGVIVLRERLRPWQWFAVGVGTVAVAVLTVDWGHPDPPATPARLPWIALALAGTFGLYGLVKKQLGLPPAEGLFVETALLALPALAYLWCLAADGTATFGSSLGHSLLLAAAGVVTVVPLLLFAGAANRIPLTALGILQYVGPVLQFLLGVLVFHEPMPVARLAGFGLVWLALLIFTIDMFRIARRRAMPALVPVEG